MEWNKNAFTSKYWHFTKYYYTLNYEKCNFEMNIKLH